MLKRKIRRSDALLIQILILSAAELDASTIDYGGGIALYFALLGSRAQWQPFHNSQTLRELQHLPNPGHGDQDPEEFSQPHSFVFNVLRRFDK